jgi:hypothetical protein
MCCGKAANYCMGEGSRVRSYEVNVSSEKTLTCFQPRSLDTVWN